MIETALAALAVSGWLGVLYLWSMNLDLIRSGAEMEDHLREELWIANVDLEAMSSECAVQEAEADRLHGELCDLEARLEAGRSLAAMALDGKM